jgi:Glycosyl transferase family 2
VLPSVELWCGLNSVTVSARTRASVSSSPNISPHAASDGAGDGADTDRAIASEDHDRVVGWGGSHQRRDLAGTVDDHPGVRCLGVVGVRAPSKGGDLPAAAHRHTGRLQPLDQAGLEQRAGAILLTGRIATCTRGSLDDRDRPHRNIMPNAPCRCRGSRPSERISPMALRARIKQALDWRLQAVISRLDRTNGQLHAQQEMLRGTAELVAATRAELAMMRDELATTRTELATARSELTALRGDVDREIRPVLRALAAEETTNHRRLAAARARADYELAWTERDPLVSITLPTRGRAELLLNRSLPSLLRQTYSHLEVLVVGDAVSAGLAEVLRDHPDPRVRWANLSVRVLAHPDPSRHWLVGSTLARNLASSMARGRWILHFDDDDELRPRAIEQLLERARETLAEVAYGGFAEHLASGDPRSHRVFPPEFGHFGWQGALHHAALPFTRELVAAQLGVPGDQWLMERMLRAGVRFAMFDGDVWDYFPSTRRQAPA